MPATSRAARSKSACTSRRSWAWTSATRGGRRRRARTCAWASGTSRTGRSCSRPRWRCDGASRPARAAVHAAFRRIVSGRLEVEEAYAGGRTLSFGPESAALRGTVVVHDPAFYARLARDRSVGLGEAYADGQWDSPDVVAPLRIAALEMRRSIRGRRVLRGLGRPLRRLRPDALRNTVAGARRNIAAHYDLGNDLFELFLDRDLMVYSCGLY